MKIAKEFKWEMGHRLPCHKGKCRNLHGHSYKLMVEFEGTLDKNGMVLDYYDVKEIVSPIVDNLDHSVMVFNEDKELIEVLEKLNSSYVAVPFQTTAENMCGYFLDQIRSGNLPGNITAIRVWVYETENTYATDSIKL